MVNPRGIAINRLTDILQTIRYALLSKVTLRLSMPVWFYENFSVSLTWSWKTERIQEAFFSIPPLTREQDKHAKVLLMGLKTWRELNLEWAKSLEWENRILVISRVLRKKWREYGDNEHITGTFFTESRMGKVQLMCMTGLLALMRLYLDSFCGTAFPMSWSW